MGTNGLYEIQICTDSPTNKQTDKVNLTTNKQKSAEFGTVNLDSSQQKNTGNTEHIDQQEQEHHDDTVPHANTENEFLKHLSDTFRLDSSEHTSINEVIGAGIPNFNEFLRFLSNTLELDGSEHTNITELIEAGQSNFNDQDHSRQPRSTSEWFSYAEKLRKNAMTRLQSGSVKRGRHGHDVILVLDCSERMKGAKFDTMIETAKTYVNGIKQIKRVRMLEDNIGLAVFGGTSRIVVQTTSDYDLVLEEIGKLKPEGEAPLVGGLLLGLAGALGGGTSDILGNEVPGYMVVLTDGFSANIKPEVDQDIDPSYLTGDFKQDKISIIIKKIAGFAVKIFYVPIGDNEQNEVMQSAVSETNGKVICRQEIHRLVRMTQVLILAAEVASDLRKKNSNPTAAEVREKIVQQTSRPDDAHDDCVDLVLEFVKPRIKERKKGLYSELVCRTLLLGDRVRRGPDWSFHEQDSGLAGTVVGQDSDSEAVWVEWDNGHLNMYIYDERLDKYSIKKVQEPRVLADELVAVGCKVTRGKDWTYADADGGPGSVGTVLCVNQDGSVLVRWGSSNTDEYKMGMNGLFEIQICNDSSTRKPTYKADANTNKYQSADSSKSNDTAGQEKKKSRSSDKNIQLPWLVDGGEFQRMLSKGEYLSYENRLSLGGPCGAGKSTLASMLIGEEIPLKWNSTDGLVIYFGRNGIDIENRKMIPLQKGELGHEVFAKILRGEPYIGNESDQIIRQGTQTSVKRVRTEAHTVLTFESPTNFTQDDNETPNYSTDQFATETKVSISQSEMENYSTEVLYNVMPLATTDVQTFDCQKLQLQSDILEEVRNGQFRIKTAASDIIDFGGQKAYDMTHQLFIQHRGSFLLMFDGRLGLHNQLDDYPEFITAAIILRHWVDSVLTYTEDTDDIMPKILFAATHKDQCEGDIEIMRASFIHDIEVMFSKHEKRDHIHLDTVYFINGIDKNDPEIQHMTDQIVLFAMQQSTWGQPRPMQWVPLELQISKMKMENINIITYEEIQSINKLNADLALGKDQLNDFLLVQHSLGKLMYYNLPGLDKYIIIHPPALVNILKSFVTDKKFFPADRNLESILQTLTQTGKIYRTDLLKLWQQDYLRQYMKDDSVKEFVIQLLVHLDILIVPKAFKESSANVYFVPCMIKTIQPDFRNLQRFQDRTICLEYSFTKTSIPSALAYKVIGAAIINWPLKEESEKPNKPCLYHQAAVLNVSEDEELRIWFEDNRVIVALTNKNSLLSISPDIAASIQECLTMNIESSLLFYFNSFGKKIKPTEVFEPFTLALGLPCGNGVCSKSVKHVNEENCWTCDRDKNHETKYLKYWIFDKSQTMCAESCKGLSYDELRTEPSDKHLVRLVSQIGIRSFPEFYLHLGMTAMQWENTSHVYGSQSCEGIMTIALMEWKNESKLSDRKDPSLKDLSDALEKVNLKKDHAICQVFREETKLQDIDDLNLQAIPSDGVLKELSNHVGNRALQLGIELGVSFDEVEISMYKFPKDLPGLIEDILQKWKTKSKIKTFKRLMLALQRVKGGGGKYLRRMLKKPEQ